MLWNALWFKRNEPSKKHHLSLACRASKRLPASLLAVLGENRHSRPIRLVIHDPLRGDQLGSLRSARKKKPGAPPLVAARLPVEPPQKNPLDKLGLPRSRSFFPRA